MTEPVENKKEKPKLERDKATVSDKDLRAAELRLQKLPYEVIAREVGYAGPSGAYKAVRRALRVQTEIVADELRDEELATLDKLQEKLMPLALNGDYRAIDRLLNVMERRARYVPGINVPVEITHRSITEARTEAEETLAKFRPKLSLVEDAG